VVALGLVFAGKMTAAPSRHSVGQSFVARIMTSGSSGNRCSADSKSVAFTAL
jgi:hypothetical protein